MNVTSFYVQERLGRVHRITVSGGEPQVSCQLPEAHEVIDEHEFLEIARLRPGDLCATCLGPVEEGARA